MKTYADFREHAPPALDKAERDDWFRDHGYDPEDVIRMAVEVAQFRTSDLVDGDQLSARELVEAMALACMFGFELAVRLERSEAPDLTPPNNGSVS